MSILNYINIPNQAKINQYVAKKEMIEMLDADAKTKRLFDSDLQSIHLIGELSEDTIRIRRFENDEYLYESILVFQIKLKKKDHIATLNERIQFVFPNPIVAIYEYQDTHLISLSTKRKNKVDSSKSVIEQIYTTDWFKEDGINQLFLANLDATSIKANHLKDYYEQLINIIYAQKLVNLTGAYPKKIADANYIRSVLKQIEREKSQLISYEESYKEATMMSDKMTFHSKIKQQKDYIEEITNKLKENM